MFSNKTFINTIKRYCRTDRYLKSDLKPEDDECMRIMRKQVRRLDVILHYLESYTNAIKSQRQDYFNRKTDYIKKQIADTKLKKAFDRGELDQYIKICEDEDDSWFDELCEQVRRNYAEHRRRVLI